MTNTVSQSSTGTGLMYPKTKYDPAWDLWAETLAPYEAILAKYLDHQAQTSRDIFSQWSRDANPGGFSAKMFITLMRWNSTQLWDCSDTQTLLRGWTARRLQGKAGPVNSWSVSIQNPPPKNSRWWLPESLIRTLIRCCQRNKKPFRVLLRTREDVLVYSIVMFTKDKKKEFVASHTLSGSLFKDCLLDGLTEYLNRLANEPSETPSPSWSPGGSERGSKKQ